MAKQINERIKIVNQNVQGLKGRGKRRKVLSWAKKKRFDVLTIQEAHIEDCDIDDWKEDWKGQLVYSSGSNRSRGVAILIEENVEHTIHNEQHDEEGRWIILDITIKGKRVTLGTYYGPNEDNPNHLVDLFEKINEMENEDIIITGDFNLVLNVNIDKHGGQKKTNSKCQKYLLEQMENHNLSDIWRIKNPLERKYTWISNTTPKIMCRLDFMLLSDNLQGYYNKADIIPGYLSDHSCTTLILELHDNTRGRGFWKYNKTLNNDETLKEQIIQTIDETIKENEGTDDSLMWDLLKCKIRGTCIKRAITISKGKKCRQEALTVNLTKQEEDLQQQIIKSNNADCIKEIEDRINNIKSQLDELITERTRGAALRNRTEWHEEGDKASKLFLNLEKSRGTNKTIKKLRNNLGELITDNKEILDLEAKFYTELFSSQKPLDNHKIKKEEEEMFQIPGNKILEEDHENLVKPIEEQEIWEIIKNNPPNKSPGTDGFNNEFYKEHWQIIKKYVIKSMNHSLKRGKLNLSQRRGIISLIPKPQKDLEELKNWRPITLLNQDYKYLTKAIANRIQKLLPNIIEPDQGGFVPGRYIGCNIQRIMNTFETCKEENIKGVLVNIDFEKAFDTLEWKHMSKSLKYLNFPTTLVNWIETIYNDIETCIINNGNTTEYIKPERGVRQGCPLSPYLFIITMEVFNRWIKKSAEDIGLRDKRNNNYIISQFADDTSFSLQATHNSVYKLFNLLDIYSSISGLKVNINKTEIILMGATQESDIPKRYRRYIKQEIKYLGSTLSTDNKTTTERNIEDAMKKINNLITTWNRRRMPISGKIAIVKSLLIPQITYHLSVLTSPEKKTVKEINQLLYKFINNGGKEKIKRTIMIAPYEEGGFKMTDLESFIKAIKIRWIERLIKIEGVWKKYITDKIGPDIAYVTRCNIKYNDLPFNLATNNMWNEVWKTWCGENSREPEIMDEIMNQSIWWNSYIRINKKPLYKKKWADNGILWIQDLVIEEHNQRRWKTIKEIRDEYKITIDTMDYNSIKSAIPKEWRRALKQEIEESDEEEDYKLIDQLMDKKRPTKYMYEELIRTKKEKPIKAMNKWRRDLQQEIEYNTILKAHKNNHWCTLNNRIRSYNFNYLNRNVPYNKRLKDMTLREDDTCKWCKGQETLIHMYWYCPKKFRLWLHLNDLQATLNKEKLDLTKKRCLLGIPDENKTHSNRRTEQLLCLLVKNYIHVCKCSEDIETTIIGLELFIKSHLRIEKESAKGKGTIEQFKAEWKGWIEWM
jgi:exonuclease III